MAQTTANSVLIIDRSATVRQVMTRILDDGVEFKVLAAVAEPRFAWSCLQRGWPDVILFDGLGGAAESLEFVRAMQHRKVTPVVLCTAQSGQHLTSRAEALALGACDIFSYPALGVQQFLLDSAQRLRILLSSALHRGRGDRFPPRSVSFAPPKYTADVILPMVRDSGDVAGGACVVAIGTSTGGTTALETVLTGLPVHCPGIVVVQHMPELFTAAFARRLNGLCDIEVREASHGDRVLPGRALIAPGARHMLLMREKGQYVVHIIDGPPVNRHRPSVDVLFRSVAACAGTNALGVIMTGMGDDGAAGLLEMREGGASTLAQDQQSCVVYGMPAVAVKIGAAQRSVPLSAIAAEIVAHGKAVAAQDSETAYP